MGAAGVAVGAALPWARSGRRPLSGYDLVGVARRFGLTTGTAARAAATVVLALPLLAALALALAAVGRRAGSLAVSVVVGLAGLGCAGWVASVAQGSAGLGVVATLAAAVCCLGGSAGGFARSRARETWRT